MPNHCTKTRAEVEGKAYRIISFFHKHPSEIPLEEWNTLKIKEDIFVVDKLTFALMAECESELLVQENSGPEPTVVAVKLSEKKDTENSEPEPTVVAVKLSEKKIEVDIEQSNRVNKKTSIKGNK